MKVFEIIKDDKGNKIAKKQLDPKSINVDFVHGKVYQYAKEVRCDIVIESSTDDIT